MTKPAVSRSRSLPDGACWTFYDSWKAFPLNRLHAEKAERGELQISLSAADGGTHGEFGIVWYELGGRDVAKLEVSEDGWEALRLSGLVELLAPYNGSYPTLETLAALLREHGFEDRTEALRGHGALDICPTCHGKGWAIQREEDR